MVSIILTRNTIGRLRPCEHLLARFRAAVPAGIRQRSTFVGLREAPKQAATGPKAVPSLSTLVAALRLDKLNSSSQRVPQLAAPKSAVVEEMLRQVAEGAEEPFYVVDIGAALDRLSLWRELLPEVEPFYAVKCCPDPSLLYALAQAGMGFDCASKGEMEQMFQLGVGPERILYANPCKQPSHLKYAARQRVPLAVVDSEDELRKHAELYPEGEVLVRIAVDDSQAQCVMSCKYGAPMASTGRLLRRAIELGVRVRGVSFHAGSGCYSAQSFVDAVDRGSAVFDEAALLGLKLDILDIGGGFPGSDDGKLSFTDIAVPLRHALHRQFPASRGVRLIAEPGRFIAEQTHTLAVNIIGKKVVQPAEGGDGSTMYFVNDGLYGSFNSVLYDHASPTAELLAPGTAATDDLLPASIWGPTCDGLDCVVKETRLPDMQVGSWLFFERMGAYTAAAGSNFNGMPLPEKVYLHAVDSSDDDAGAAVSYYESGEHVRMAAAA